LIDAKVVTGEKRKKVKMTKKRTAKLAKKATA
jgi:hypothetical protein